MTHQEIFTRITENKRKIEELTDVTTFVLNPEVVKLEKEIEDLQANCKHCFVEGICIHCTKEEEI